MEKEQSMKFKQVIHKRNGNANGGRNGTGNTNNNGNGNVTLT